jgi:hypothetical protein
VPPSANADHADQPVAISAHITGPEDRLRRLLPSNLCCLLIRLPFGTSAILPLSAAINQLIPQ